MQYKLTINQAAAIEEGPTLTPFKNVFDNVSEVRSRHLEFKASEALEKGLYLDVPMEWEFAFVAISGARFVYKSCPTGLPVSGVTLTAGGSMEYLMESQLYFARAIQKLDTGHLKAAKLTLKPEMFQEKPDDPINFTVVYGIRPLKEEPVPPMNNQCG